MVSTPVSPNPRSQAMGPSVVSWPWPRALLLTFPLGSLHHPLCNGTTSSSRSFVDLKIWLFVLATTTKLWSVVTVPLAPWDPSWISKYGCSSLKRLLSYHQHAQNPHAGITPPKVEHKTYLEVGIEDNQPSPLIFIHFWNESATFTITKHLAYKIIRIPQKQPNSCHTHRAKNPKIFKNHSLDLCNQKGISEIGDVSHLAQLLLLCCQKTLKFSLFQTLSIWNVTQGLNLNPWQPSKLVIERN